VVRELIGEVGRLRAENERLSGALTKRKTEREAVKDELARLKDLSPRPPQKPSGMDNTQTEAFLEALDPGIVGIRPQSASLRPGASFLRTTHLQADRRASQWHGRFQSGKSSAC